MSSTATAWIPTETFGTRLVMVRRHLGWGQSEAAEKCGLDQRSWSTWERGASPRNAAQIVAKIAATTGADRDWLMWGTIPADATLSGPKPPYISSTSVIWDAPLAVGM